MYWVRTIKPFKAPIFKLECLYLSLTRAAKNVNIYISRLCTIQLHVCLTALVLRRENILLVTLVHMLSLIGASLSEPHTSESFRWIVILRI